MAFCDCIKTEDVPPLLLKSSRIFDVASSKLFPSIKLPPVEFEIFSKACVCLLVITVCPILSTLYPINCPKIYSGTGAPSSVPMPTEITEIPSFFANFEASFSFPSLSSPSLIRTTFLDPLGTFLN